MAQRKARNKRILLMTNFGAPLYPKTITEAVQDDKRDKNVSELLDDIYEKIRDGQGIPGEGVPAGGSTGQILAKKTGNDYDTEWKDYTPGGSGSGEDGKTPIIGTITAQSVSESELPSFSLTHTSNDSLGNPIYTGLIRIPKGRDGLNGEDGENGKTPILEIGTVTTLAPGSQATVDIISSGVDASGNPKYTINFGIPRGANGDGSGGGGSTDWSEITGKPSWIGSTKPTYTAAEVGALPTSHNTDPSAHNNIQTNISNLTSRVQILENTGGGTIIYEDVDPGDFFGTSDSIPIPVSSISITPNTFNINVGTSTNLVATVLPVNASNRTISWSSSNQSIATVNNGVVTAVAEGQVIITATSTDGSNVTGTSSGTIEIANPDLILVNNIELNKAYLLLEAGLSEQLTATVTPENADNKTIVWSSSDSNIGTVVNGLVTAVSNGSAEIRASSVDGSGKYGSCDLVVKDLTPASGLIADWDFGLYPNGYQGEIDDLSGNGNHPIVVGLDKTITGRDGIINGVFMHNSGASKIDFITPEILTSDTSLTIECYAHLRRPYNQYSPNGVLDITVGTQSELLYQMRVFMVTHDSGHVVLLQTLLDTLYVTRSGLGSTDNFGNINPPIKIDGIDDDVLTDTFHHLVLAISSTTISGYLDGVLLDSRSTNTTYRYAGKLINFFNGNYLRADIKRIRVYNETLTALQIAENYNELVTLYS